MHLFMSWLYTRETYIIVYPSIYSSLSMMVGFQITKNTYKNTLFAQ